MKRAKQRTWPLPFYRGFNMLFPRLGHLPRILMDGAIKRVTIVSTRRV